MNNFLSIVWYRVLPAQFGGQKGIAGFNQQLGKRVSLTCLCSKNNIPSPSLSYNVENSLPVSRLQFWNPLTRHRILSYVKAQTFDHIIIEHPYHGWLGKYKDQLNCRIIIHAHNIEYLRMKSRGKWWWRLIWAMEKKAFAHADLILFKTSEDQAVAADEFKIASSKCVVVPYGIEKKKSIPGIKEQVRIKHNVPAGAKLLVYAGSPGYEPNEEAISILLREVIPALQHKDFSFHLLICGSATYSLEVQLKDKPRVTATGFVHDLEEYLQSADVFINPVISGSGVQTKNLEAVAAGCPVVTTAFGAKGLPAYLVGKSVFVPSSGNWDAFAEMIIEASEKRSDTSARFYEEFSWEAVVDRFLKAAC